ncbi:PREDICTED: uncharacterized protein LOC105561071 [Vollenhovia emeryi]|uniref:uncharacterized protein LOC105561071 n=1 Tax=Vollenhovia emeryi TaxID=411798 RepID=UPI0005F575F4|nr:PREDICTED: uncharacterized protein LOC105561071 [Vollenhovia emeryi]
MFQLNDKNPKELSHDHKINRRKDKICTLSAILGKTLGDRVPNVMIRETSDVTDIVRWARQRRREWNGHVSRMAEERIARTARDGKPTSRRPPGRPPKRWMDSWTSGSQETN